ncbi:MULTISPECIES: alpha/beta fold hydrolase [unclassified Amycolatopsis]|uniref:alpha/beta fold hydrolase n=1 Tax=unclassified Amycolatopsis TaxID=2618356 RepID=UPI001C69B7CA|nr:alpha/beta hydrolase [Amycolatopsis sp. DSM 110486]QYN18797.1 alpha/beta hydrolase [Amycolatopsis sp. DSM 110486]
MTYLETPEVVLYFEDHLAKGEAPGDPLVLLHGWACDSSDWAALIGRFTPRHRVVTVDLRGYGRSSTGVDGYSPAVLARDVVRVLDALALGPAVVAGHSAGAEVAATIAVTYPEHVRALVTVDPAYGFGAEAEDRLRDVSRSLSGADPVQVAVDYFKAFDDNPSTPRELARLHRASAQRARPDVLREMFDEFAFGADSFHFLPGTGEFLRRRQAPLLAIYRNETRGVVGEQFAERADDQVLTYSGAGHWLHQEQPERFTADVERWLDGLDPDHTPTTGAQS